MAGVVAGRPPGGALSSPSSLVSALPSNSQIQDLGLLLSPPASSCSGPSSPCLPRKGSLGVSARCPRLPGRLRDGPCAASAGQCACFRQEGTGRALRTLGDGREKRLRPIGNFWGPPRSSLKAQRQLGSLHRVAEETGGAGCHFLPKPWSCGLLPTRCHLALTLRRLFPVPDPPTPPPGGLQGS